MFDPLWDEPEHNQANTNEEFWETPRFKFWQSRYFWWTRIFGTKGCHDAAIHLANAELVVWSFLDRRPDSQTCNFFWRLFGYTKWDFKLNDHLIEVSYVRS